MTKEREIYITSQDLKRLKKELSMAGVSYSHGRDDLQLLAKELDRAKIIFTLLFSFSLVVCLRIKFFTAWQTVEPP